MTTKLKKKGKMIELRDILLILITCAITIPLTLGAERLIQIWTTQHPNTIG